MKKMIVLAALALVGCGVDGEPVQPTGGVNVTLNGDGVGLGANLGLKKGPVRVGLGL
ncbi:hypothetical protein [uncultured Sulfitobacter sp.]|uniref:hypothetical protein n=1 Tax=uncultured Sulfitobacter sp. TaxID=191468 RepID=UPI002627A67B|nr:hypothetical protein [uncultured Sulfitobacter sp.]